MDGVGWWYVIAAAIAGRLFADDDGSLLRQPSIASWDDPIGSDTEQHNAATLARYPTDRLRSAFVFGGRLLELDSLRFAQLGQSLNRGTIKRRRRHWLTAASIVPRGCPSSRRFSDRAAPERYPERF
jgi:hypothetical protein